MEFRKKIKKEKILVGMIHIKASPGTPKSCLRPNEIIKKAIEEAKTYKNNGIDTIMIENMHDVPYIKNPGPETIALMAIIGKEIKKLGLFCGIQILTGANKEALAVAHTAGLDFIRVENFIYGHLADEGYLESCAGELLRYRKMINAENVLIFTDIKKKHSSHAITQDITIEEAVKTAEFFLSDGIVVTGKFTGIEPDLKEVKRIRKITKLPVIIGSGIKAENIKKFMPYADLFIVGSYFKKNGFWENELDEKRIKKLVKIFNSSK